MSEPLIELVGPVDLDRARVALIVAEAVDESVVKVTRAIQRDGVPNVVVCAARFDEQGVVQAVAEGVSGFLRRAEATSARLVELLRQADEQSCHLPEGLLKRAASMRVHHVSGPSVINMSEPALGQRSPCAVHGGLSTATEVRLSAREAEVLRLVADGYDTAEVAEQLAYSESTIKGVLAKLMIRLDARNRCHAVAIVVRDGLI